MPELLTVSNRIGIMREGQVVKLLENSPGVTEEQLMKRASGEIA